MGKSPQLTLTLEVNIFKLRRVKILDALAEEISTQPVRDGSRNMEGSQPPVAADNALPPSTSLTTRLTNVFVAPTQVFDGVKAGRPAMVNWLVPLIMTMVAGMIYTMVAFSQPAVIQGIKDVQTKKFQQMVSSGKLTQQQADQQQEAAEKFMTPAVFQVFGILGSIFGSAVSLFLVALVIWVLGKFPLRGHFDFMRAVEVAGLSMMITVLGTIVAMLLGVIYGDLAMTPGPILLVGHVDPDNPLHALLSALNLSTIWYLAVLSMGLARLSGVRFIKPAICLFGLWFGLWAVFKLGLPMLLKKEFGG